MNSRLVFLFVLIATLVHVEVQACGESLYRAGRGVAYRAHSAPLPGNLLVYASSESEQQMAKALAKSGHKVQVVSSEQELAAQVSKGGYDIVLAPFRQSAAVQASTESAQQHSVFLPIGVDRQEARVAKQAHGHALAANDNLRTYLKAIHRVLKAEPA